MKQVCNLISEPLRDIWSKGKLPLANSRTVAASCHLCLHASNRSLFACGLSINSRAYVARWPTRAPRSTCANKNAWVVITPKCPKANSKHTAWTRTPALNFVLKAAFSHLLYPILAIVPFWFGWIKTWLGVVRRPNRTPHRPILACIRKNF